MSWTWEAKSVNAKGLDVRCRLPNRYEALEPEVRTRAGGLFTRGNLNVTLSVDEPPRTPTVRINRELLRKLIHDAKELRDADIERASLDGLFSVPGVLERVDDAADSEEEEARRERVRAAILEDLTAGLEALHAARDEEGAALARTMTGHLDGIAALTERAASAQGATPEAFKARLKDQIETLLEASPALSEERLSQEAALLATKADIREEVDRLRAHVEQARALMASGEPVGRRLDFLCQEFNREANTLCSKAPDLEITNIGLELKASIEQMREQVQNIE